MKKPYLKKYGGISKFVIWIVDGAFVRKNIDIDFNNFGQHYRFKFIPENEFWIDKEHGGKEEHFFVQHLLVENKMMEAGASYFDAITKADLAERAERMKNKFIIMDFKTKKHKAEMIKKVHKKILHTYSNKNLRVWIVDGKLVRSFFFIDFTEGGHDLVYPFIPSGEIWLDDDMSQKERKFALIHEIHERNLMAKGSGYGSGFMTKEWNKENNHTSAHKSASEIEYFCRHHPEKTDKKIKNELKIATSLSLA
ncbi:MAG: hypothetical protein ABH804_00310 [archaeon]